jgi:large subunit ribosomal protein L29
MKAKELRQKSEKELNKILMEKKEKLSQLNFDLASGKVKNIDEIKATKRDIARILTLLRELKDKR